MQGPGVVVQEQPVEMVQVAQQEMVEMALRQQSPGKVSLMLGEEAEAEVMQADKEEPGEPGEVVAEQQHTELKH
jgi:hypothetical protein